MLNTSTKGLGNLLGAIASNASDTTATIANSAIKAANVVSDIATDTTSTLVKAANSGMNSFSFNSLIPLSNTATTTRGNSNTTKENSNTFGNIFNMSAKPNNGSNNVNKGNNGNNGRNNVNTGNNGSNGTNIFENVTLNANTSNSKMSSWALPIGIFVVLVGVFIGLFITFKPQFMQAYENASSSLRSLFGYPTVPPSTPPPSDPVTSSMPSATTTTAQNIVEKILPLGKKEVFNISSNEYTSYDAEPLCRALGAELATYDQVKTAWEKGADWCNYGWVKGQVAVYPTQQETYDKLQTGPADEKFACGKPGVNGGYFDNPEMNFGVNCYGVKPNESSNDERVLMQKGSIPKTPATLKVDQQIQEFKSQLGQVPIVPFNQNEWSSD